VLGVGWPYQRRRCASAQTSGVAYMAHVGGFIAGLLLTLLLRPAAGLEQLA
jgi:membrane associated rhomboid family serine protease